MKKILFVSFLLFNINAFAQATDISGAYNCTGYDPNNHVAFQTVMMVKNMGGVYQITEINKQNPKITGTEVAIPFASGNQFALAYQYDADPKNFGVQALTLNPSTQTLSGSWVQAGQTALGTEVCQKLVIMSQ